MFKRLEQHLESNHILVAEQFGFRKGISMENAIFTLTNNVLTESMTSSRGYLLWSDQGIQLC